MVILYVVSSEEGAGKTAVCAGLGKYLQGEGRKVGYIRLVAGESGAGGDTAFMKQVLDLPEAVESLCPPSGDVGKIKEACDAVSRGRDVVIMEGRLEQNAVDIAKTLNAGVIAVEAYSGQTSGFVETCRGFGESLLGVTLNKVPVSLLKRVQDEFPAQLAAAGINVLGVLPEDRVLFAITVGELTESIRGKVLNDSERSTELVEEFMLGAMVVDSGLDYFGRKSRKAAVVRQDRPDMQLAALETSTRCLVLAGSSEPPVYNVLEKAQNRGIPIISTDLSIGEIIANIEDALSKGRINQEKKLPKLTEIVKRHLDLKTVV